MPEQARPFAPTAVAVALACACGVVAGCAGPTSRPVTAPTRAVEVVHVRPAVQPADPTGRQPGPVAPTGGSATVLSIPSIGIHDLVVVAYDGSADDPAGTLIEDTGVAASPLGPAGGVRPGQVGNFVVTGHRTSAGGPLRRLPSLRMGAHVLVTSAGEVFDYVVTGNLVVSFRSAASRARQSSPVPGMPGVRPTQPMITLSTCATPEDHAAGDYWHDSLGNPEHRIDRIGVLVAVRPA